MSKPRNIKLALFAKIIIFITLLVYFFHFPKYLYADVPCNNIQSISYIWPCNGSQGYFSIISDGCHVLIKLDDCLGTYHEWFYRMMQPSKPNTGDSKVDYLFNKVLTDFKPLSIKKGRTDDDVTNFLNNTITKIVKEKIIEGLDKSKEVAKGKVKLNCSSQREISEFKEKVKMYTK